MIEPKKRLNTAREAFLKGDKDLSKQAHTPQTIAASIQHKEGHKVSFALPQVILGGQDGLVNVLGIILGMAAATADAKIVIVAGLAATFAESISMAAVAYTSKIAEADYYQSEYEREKWEIEHFNQGEIDEVRSLYKQYGFEGKLLDDVVSKITADKAVWLDIMMTQELKLEPVERKEAIPAAFIVGGSALVGSFIPLIPFFFFPVKLAIILALIISTLTLFSIGYYKAKVTLGRNLLKQGIEIMIIGMLSALVGYLVGTVFKI